MHPREVRGKTEKTNPQQKKRRKPHLLCTQISLPHGQDGRTEVLTDAFDSWGLGASPPPHPRENSPPFCTTRAARTSGPPVPTASGRTENQVPGQSREATCSESQELQSQFTPQGGGPGEQSPRFFTKNHGEECRSMSHCLRQPKPARLTPDGDRQGWSVRAELCSV